MPIYEFLCPENNTIYSFLAKRILAPEEQPRCPENPEWRLQRIVSPFAITGSKKKSRGDEETDGASDDDLDDPRMEAAMAELERDMAGMDEDNPDPRQLARLMRKMADLTGERLDGQMEEMVRKLEEGADPDSLEEEFGDALDDDDAFGGGAADGPASTDEDDAPGNAARQALSRALARARRAPRRDPELYDWNEYA